MCASCGELESSSEFIVCSLAVKGLDLRFVTKKAEARNKVSERKQPNTGHVL